MDFKQFIMNKLNLFFMLTTFISIAIYILGSAFDGNTRFGYEAYLSPLVFAGACILPSLVTYSTRELKVKEMMVRMILEFILIEAVVLGIAFSTPMIDTGRVSVVLALAGSVLIIYLVACFFDWMRESAEAKRMTDDLIKFQKMHQVKMPSESES